MPQFIKVLEAESSGEYVKIMRYFSLPDITSILFLRRSIGLGWKPTVISCTKKATTRWILCEISRFRYFLGWVHALLRALISLLPCPPHPNHISLRMTGKRCSWCVWPTKLVGNSLTRETLQSSRSAFSKLHHNEEIVILVTQTDNFGRKIFAIKMILGACLNKIR